MIDFDYRELSSPSIIIANKPIGKTPLEIIQLLKKNDKYKNTKMSYAGRLDPMAHGLMIILMNGECFKQHVYHNLNKTYKFKLLLGIATDTFDVLGKITKNSLVECNTELLYSNILQLIGTHNQEYPPFSSVRVNKHPLWYYAKHNKLDTITIPSKKITIYDMIIEDDTTISYSDLIQYVSNNIDKLDNKHDFRQTEILKQWQIIKDLKYRIITINTDVSCGTYIRSICNLIGLKIGTPAIALDIFRTCVGTYNL